MFSTKEFFQFPVAQSLLGDFLKKGSL